jgi:hypothetical protein
MLGPVLEYEDNKTTLRCCDQCQNVLHKLDPEEHFSYFVGNHVIPVVARIPKGECPRCGYRWVSESAKTYRDEAFQQAIDDFWKSHLDALGIKDEEMSSVMFVVSRLMLRVGEDKTRQVAAELGRWLAGCSFIY